MSTAVTLINAIQVAVINPILLVLFLCGLLMFIYGILEFLVNLSRGGKADIGTGKKHILWGLLGMFVMSGAAGIIQLIKNIFQ